MLLLLLSLDLIVVMFEAVAGLAYSHSKDPDLEPDAQQQGMSELRRAKARQATQRSSWLETSSYLEFVR